MLSNVMFYLCSAPISLAELVSGDGCGFSATPGPQPMCHCALVFVMPAQRLVIFSAFVSSLLFLAPFWFPWLQKPRKCQTCLGASHVTCTACMGRGKQGGLFSSEPMTDCDSCGKKGRLRCVACSGTGLANNWLWRPAQDAGWGARGE